MFSIYDIKAEAYLKPFYMQSKGQAIRAFTESLQDPESGMGKWPADFTLFELGEFDDACGRFSPLEANLSVGNGLEFKAVAEVASSSLSSITKKKQA